MSAENPAPSWRKPAGMLAILLLIAFWSILIANLAEYISQLHWALQAIIYTVAGISWIWIFRLRNILIWMETGRFR